jgi:hypothetical protein
VSASLMSMGWRGTVKSGARSVKRTLTMSRLRERDCEELRKGEEREGKEEGRTGNETPKTTLFLTLTAPVALGPLTVALYERGESKDERRKEKKIPLEKVTLTFRTRQFLHDYGERHRQQIRESIRGRREEARLRCSSSRCFSFRGGKRGEGRESENAPSP